MERIELIDYLILSITLMMIGIYGLLTRQQLLKILVSVELIATAASMNFVLLASSMDKALGQAFLVLAFSTDTCITGIFLALLIFMSKKYGTTDLRRLADLEWHEVKNEKPEDPTATGDN
jgi:NADH:ubiquinone oxidoreductase subunit K